MMESGYVRQSIKESLKDSQIVRNHQPGTYYSDSDTVWWPLVSREKPSNFVFISPSPSHSPSLFVSLCTFLSLLLCLPVALSLCLRLTLFPPCRFVNMSLTALGKCFANTVNVRESTWTASDAITFSLSPTAVTRAHAHIHTKWLNEPSMQNYHWIQIPTPYSLSCLCPLHLFLPFLLPPQSPLHQAHKHTLPVLLTNKGRCQVEEIHHSDRGGVLQPAEQPCVAPSLPLETTLSVSHSYRR